jgi:hypothetical protein
MWVQTIVSVGAGQSTTLIAANPRRERLRWMVTGAGDVTIAPGSVTVTAGNGMAYAAAAAAGKPGGADDFQFDCARDAFSVFAAAATQVTVWEFVQNQGVPATSGVGANNLNATP